MIIYHEGTKALMFINDKTWYTTKGEITSCNLTYRHTSRFGNPAK